MRIDRKEIKITAIFILSVILIIIDIYYILRPEHNKEKQNEEYHIEYNGKVRLYRICKMYETTVCDCCFISDKEAHEVLNKKNKQAAYENMFHNESNWKRLNID